MGMALNAYCDRYTSSAAIVERALAYAARANDTARETGLLTGLGQGVIFNGWALTEQHRNQERVDRITRGIRCVRCHGAAVGIDVLAFLVARADGKSLAGSTMSLLPSAEAFAFALRRTMNVFFERELYRLKDELTSIQSLRYKDLIVEEEVEACFLRAIEVAQKQQDKSLELRAIDEPRAPMAVNKASRAEAHQMLLEIYNWFTEGFDTKDLQEAKMLIGGVVALENTMKEEFVLPTQKSIRLSGHAQGRLAEKRHYRARKS